MRAVLNGDGQSFTFTQEVIADERSRPPPLQSLVGLDRDAFLAITLPNSRLFKDGFGD